VVRQTDEHEPARARLLATPIGRDRSKDQRPEIASTPSDAFARNVAGVQWLHRDEGRRYSFALAGGVVTAIHPDGTQTPLTASDLLPRQPGWPELRGTAAAVSSSGGLAQFLFA